MGKGDRRRPLQADPERFAERWERTFGPIVRGMESDGPERACLRLFYTGHSEWDSGDVWREQMECRLPRGHDGECGLDEERRGRFKDVPYEPWKDSEDWDDYLGEDDQP